MLNIKSITKTFGEITALDNFSTDIPSGEIVGFLGPNGAGKTTMMRIMTGFLEPDSGFVLVNGQSIMKNRLTISRFIGYLPENNPLYHDMLVSDLIDLSCSIYGIPASKQREYKDEVVERANIASVYYRPIYQLSRGFKQRVGLALAIIHKPEILILDEPTEGLDPNQRIEIRKTIKEFGKDRTVVLSSHVMQEVEAVCDRVIVINEGRLVKDANINQFKRFSTGDKETIICVELKGKNILEKFGKLGIKILDKSKNEKGIISLRIAVDRKKDIRPNILSMVNENGWELLEIYTEKSSLESIFKELTTSESQD